MEDGGLPHEKYGVFTDKNGDKLYFIGSMNMTAAGIMSNGETIDCVCSWTSSENRERVVSFERHFNEIWNGEKEGVIVYPANKFCTQIMADYKDINLDELVQKEEEFIKQNIPQKSTIDISKPHFPTKYPNGPMEYQEEAYQSWITHGRTGIFAMATGTGKTVTSLNCALHEFYENKIYNLLILVPTLDLVEQWKEEVKSFGFKKITLVSSLNPSWRSDIAKLSSKTKRGIDSNFVIISTYDSFVNKDFQILLPSLSKRMILIADEAHNIGSKSVRECFRNLTVIRRIALSATPKRIYDEEGTSEIESFFSDSYPYTYSFPMSKAIREGRLTQYFYFPKIAYLNEQEMIKYTEYTQQLLHLFDHETKTFKDEGKAERILMARKRIIHKAEDKLRVYRNILNEIGQESLRYTFVYAPQGKFETIDGETIEEDSTFLQRLLDITKEIYPVLRCNTFTSKDSKESRKRLLAAFASGELDVLLAMKCLDEGVDVPKAKYGIFTSSTGNPREFIQRRGRLLRKSEGKTHAYIYDIVVVPPPSTIDNTIMERNLFKSELTRVAYFAHLSVNNFSEGGAMSQLNELASRFNLSLAQLINEIEQ